MNLKKKRIKKPNWRRPLNLFLSEDERNALKAKALRVNLTMSGYIRKITTEQDLSINEPMPQKIKKELGSLARNANQIAIKGHLSGIGEENITALRRDVSALIVKVRNCYGRELR